MASFSSDERQLLHDSLHDFLGDRYTFEHQLKLARSTDGPGFGREEWAQYAEMGWLGVALPESAGGADGGMTELGIVLAAGGHFLVLEPLLGTLVMGAGAIAGAGTQRQIERLEAVAAGREIVVLCHTEPDAGYARDYVKAVARRNGDGYVLDGDKGFVLHAHVADTLIVSARIGNEEGPVGLFLVSPAAAGVTLVPAPALDGRQGAAAHFANVRLDEDARLGGPEAHDALALVDALYDKGALAACAEAVGAMFAVTEQTVAYLKQREQFGQPLSKFQVLQHRVVDMSVATEEARVLVHSALQAVDDELAQAQEMIWKAKVQTARAARFVGGQAVQLHGGMGMTDELVIGHYYKRLSFCEAQFGDAEWYLRQLGSRVTA